MIWRFELALLYKGNCPFLTRKLSLRFLDFYDFDAERWSRILNNVSFARLSWNEDKSSPQKKFPFKINCLKYGKLFSPHDAGKMDSRMEDILIDAPAFVRTAFVLKTLFEQTLS
jgi:hypothetical protein